MKFSSKGSQTFLTSLFKPLSVAVVGASQNPEKIGYLILRNILQGGYHGSVFPVNIKGGIILGKRVYKNLTEIPGSIDLAIICVPALVVFEILSDCEEKKVKNLIIISSGFAEIGNKKDEKKLTEFAKKTGIRILGPNVFGLYSRAANLNATFSSQKALSGSVAVISQSGALGLSLIGQATAEGIGLSTMVSVGNKADLTEADLLPYFAKDEVTKAIILYIEGLSRGQYFLDAVKKVSTEKPVIVIKAGKSQKGKEAALSHTGALAVEDRVFDDLLRQAGGIRVKSLREAFILSKSYLETRFLQGGKVLILTNGGGVGVMATDACEDRGINLCDDEEDLKKSFSGIVPSFGSVKNPVDLTGQATPIDFGKTLKASLVNKRIGAVLALYCETAVSKGEELVSVFKKWQEKFQSRKKPIVFCFYGSKETREKLDLSGVFYFTEIDDAILSFSPNFSGQETQRSLQNLAAPIKEFNLNSSCKTKILNILKTAKMHSQYFLLSDEAKQVLKLLDIPAPESFVVKNIKEALKAVNKIGYPVVLKVVSPSVFHKSDVGGVVVGIKSDGGLESAFGRMKAKFKDAVGFMVEEEVAGGLEMIVGAKRDPVFGPIIMCGLGGKYVEIFNDVSFRSFPCSAEEVFEMLKDLKSFALLEGVRGEKRKNIEGLVEIILKLGHLVKDIGGISEIEINPLSLLDNDLIALDARVLLKP